MIIAVSGEFGDELIRFVLYRIEDGRTLGRECIRAADGLEPLKRQLANLKIDLLITGRISGALERELFDAGINLITGVTGESDRILRSYLNGTLQF